MKFIENLKEPSDNFGLKRYVVTNQMIQQGKFFCTDGHDKEGDSNGSGISRHKEQECEDA